jgi:hypothetical protein
MRAGPSGLLLLTITTRDGRGDYLTISHPEARKGRRLGPRRNTQVMNLLTVKVAVELLGGCVLALFPSFLASIVHRPPLRCPTSPGGTVIVRIVGAALLVFGIACWLARNATQSRARRCSSTTLPRLPLFSLHASAQTCLASIYKASQCTPFGTGDFLRALPQ